MTKLLLLIVLVSLGVGLILFYLYRQSLKRQMQQQKVDSTKDLYRNKRRKSLKQRTYKFLQKSYVHALRFPLIKNYVLSVRKRLSVIHAYDELTIRKESMRITFIVLGGMSFVVLVLCLIGRDITFTFFVLLGAVVINGTLIENFVNKVSDNLLHQQTELIEDTRHTYNQHQMVDEAIESASEVSKYEIAHHARKIHDAITSPKAEEKLEEYYEVAPNRFLKLFAGISYLVKEYGDRKIPGKGSMYLNTLNRLKGEILEEILFRRKLRYYLNSLTIIAIVPIFFLKPIENWANNSFPIMGEFYGSKSGFIAKIIIFLVVLLSYIILKKIQDNDDNIREGKISEHKWLKALYKKKIVKFIVDRFTPNKTSREYFKNETLLKNTNTSLTVEWFYLKRIIIFGITVLVSTSLFIYMHSFSASKVLNSTTSVFKQNGIIGQLNEEEKMKVKLTTEFDKRVIDQFKGVKTNQEEVISSVVRQELGEDASVEQVNLWTSRIINKINTINNEYFKWWELLISMLFGVVAYHIPLWLLAFQRRMREMQMKIEVNQMHTIIGMLTEIERVSVDTLLVWMERFSTIFRVPLKTCNLNFQSGPKEALDELTIQAPFPPFVRTVERLQNALDRVSIQEAFGDLDTDRTYFEEEKKQENEKIINKKANWGRTIGFAPMMAVIFIYLVFPFIYVSVTSMSTVFDQLSNSI